MRSRYDRVHDYISELVDDKSQAGSAVNLE